MDGKMDEKPIKQTFDARMKRLGSSAMELEAKCGLEF